MGKKLDEEYFKVRKYTQQICELLQTPDEYRALGVLKTTLKKLQELQIWEQEILEATNTSHRANALTRILSRCMVKEGDLLPAELLDYGRVWVQGRSESADRKVPAFAPLNMNQAKTAQRHLKPFLEDAWEATLELENKEEVQQQILDEYNLTTPDEMFAFCAAFVKDWELPEEKEERARALEGANIGEMNSILENMKLDYGVVPREGG